LSDIPLEKAVICYVPGTVAIATRHKGAVVVYEYGAFEIDVLPKEFRQAGASTRSWRYGTPHERLQLLNALFVQLIVQHECQAPLVTRAFSFIPEFRAAHGVAAPDARAKSR
jgi:hypothetical protein